MEPPSEGRGGRFISPPIDPTPFDALACLQAVSPSRGELSGAIRRPPKRPGNDAETSRKQGVSNATARREVPPADVGRCRRSGQGRRPPQGADRPRRAGG